LPTVPIVKKWFIIISISQRKGLTIKRSIKIDNVRIKKFPNS